MSTHHAQISRALDYIHANATLQPSLEEIAGSVNLSPYHFQRRFRQWVGVSPKRYLRNLIVAQAKDKLRAGGSVLSTAYSVGLSGPSRLHDLFVSIGSVTPGEYKSMGEALEIQYGVHWTPFGPCSVALTSRGICNLQFLAEASAEGARVLLETEWPNATLIAASDTTGDFAYRIFHPSTWSEKKPFYLTLRGTNFQIQVWRALLGIPSGTTQSYQNIAEAIGRSPRHARAVSNAVANNPVGFLIPCHRVIRASGAVGGYQWGLERKSAILAAEGVEL